MLVDNWDAELPDKEFLVVTTGHEFLRLNEGNGIHGTQMLVVLQDPLARINVEL